MHTLISFKDKLDLPNSNPTVFLGKGPEYPVFTHIRSSPDRTIVSAVCISTAVLLAVEENSSRTLQGMEDFEIPTEEDMLSFDLGLRTSPSGHFPIREFHSYETLNGIVETSVFPSHFKDRVQVAFVQLLFPSY